MERARARSSGGGVTPPLAIRGVAPPARSGGNLCRAVRIRALVRAEGPRRDTADTTCRLGRLARPMVFQRLSAPDLAKRGTLRSRDRRRSEYTLCAVAPVKGAAVRACSDARPG